MAGCGTPEEKFPAGHLARRCRWSGGTRGGTRAPRSAPRSARKHGRRRPRLARPAPRRSIPSPERPCSLADGYYVRILALTFAASSGVTSVMPCSWAACAATCARSSSSVAAVATKAQPGTTSPQAKFFDFPFCSDISSSFPRTRLFGSRLEMPAIEQCDTGAAESLCIYLVTDRPAAASHEEAVSNEMALHVAGLWRYP